MPHNISHGPCTYDDFYYYAKIIVAPAYLGGEWTDVNGNTIPAVPGAYSQQYYSNFFGPVGQVPPGGWSGWIHNMWSGYNAFSGANAPCGYFSARINQWNNAMDTMIQNALPGLPNAYVFQRKLAKKNWAQTMWSICGCSGPVPQLTGSTSGAKLSSPDTISAPVSKTNFRPNGGIIIDDMEIVSEGNGNNDRRPNNKSKLIKYFSLDLSDLSATSESRNMVISGDNDARFTLFIVNEDDLHYNFNTSTFEAKTTKTGLINKVISGGSYINQIKFPTVTDDDQYDIYLIAGPDTEHVDYNQQVFLDNTVDINSSRGSNSKLMQKVIYQYTDLTLTISNYSPSGGIELQAPVSDTLTVSRGKRGDKLPFSISAGVSTATKSYKILKNPTADDVLSFVERTVGSAPETIPGEDIYPTVTNTDTVNGDFSGGATAITMDSAVASKMKVGDRVTGNAVLNAGTFVVDSIDSTRVFSLNASAAIADNATLSFSNQVNYQWPLDRVDKILPGMIVLGGAIKAGTTTARYQEKVIELEGTDKQVTRIKNELQAINTKGELPTIVKGLITAQSGNVVFNQQQLLELLGDSLKIGGHGIKHIKNIHGYEVEFSNLEISLVPIKTTTTSATINITTVAVASVNGILTDTSIVRGVGLNPSEVQPRVSARSATSGAGNLTLTSAQNIESGQELTFRGAGQRFNITGEIEILKAGTANAALRFDVDKLLSIT